MGVQRIYYGVVDDGIPVQKVVTVSQSKSGNIWINSPATLPCLHWLHLGPTHLLYYLVDPQYYLY
jgi:hypothetical protein